MGGCVLPESRREAAGRQVGARQLYDRADGTLRDAVELMNVRRAGGVVDGLGVEKVGHLV